MTERYTNPKDRRSSPRTDYNSNVDLILNGRLYKELITNISETGLFIKSNRQKDFEVFDKITLSFQSPDSKPVKLTGRVARKTLDGIGILYLGEGHLKAQRKAPNIEGFFT